jgi:hypothetical protein
MSRGDEMSKHTPGPWISLEGTLDNRTHGAVIFGGPGRDKTELVATTDTLDPADEDHAERMLANAARIVECVNALEGVENPAAIQHLIGKVQAAVKVLTGPEKISSVGRETIASFLSEAIAALGVK